MTGVGYKTQEHIDAIKKSCEGIEWGAIKLIQLGSITTIDEWNRAICFELWKYIETEFCLLIHEDSWIIHPELWNEKWLQYDWVSSPWPLPAKDDTISYRDEFGVIQRVGNSVGLRSRKLLKLPTDLNLEFKDFWGNLNEDGKFCVEWRHILEKQGMKYAPFEEALKFGKEAPMPENESMDTFLFHKFE